SASHGRGRPAAAGSGDRPLAREPRDGGGVRGGSSFRAKSPRVYCQSWVQSVHANGRDKTRRPANHHANSQADMRMETAVAMQGDDAGAFEALLEAHRGIVLKVAAGYARDRDERADLAQEIAAQLWRAWPGYDPGQRFSTWMYRIALNVGISHLRGAGRRERVLAPLDEVAQEAADPAGDDHETGQQVRMLLALI